ncbi:MAG: hypothetical protein PWQ57_1269 [Desulfovibrionales bacterium]|nr:hypothetical protein [Desulfovibrionales bacterium]
MQAKFLFGSLCLLACLASGCGMQEPAPEDHFGESVRNIMASQMVNPDPPRPLDPVTGLDGRYAENEMENYRKAPQSEREQQKQLYNPMLLIEALDKQ